MDIQIDFSSRVALHQQIVDQVRHGIATGKLKSGDRLPTVRALAQRLGVNVNTAAKAYAELERLGVITAAVGRGSFVAGTASGNLDAFREDRLRDLLGKAVLEALSLGYSLEQIEGALALQWARWRELRSNGHQVAPISGSPSLGLSLSIAASHDLALDLLVAQLRRSRPEVQVSCSYVGSLASLIALERGEAQVAGCHLVDEETGEYNLPFVRRVMPGENVILVNLVYRQQGLMVPKGNPKRIAGMEDLARQDVCMVNRQRGAGTRVLLDLRLRELGIDPKRIRGYDHEVGTHTAVAAAIAGGSADAGLGILSAARALDLDFMPLAKERYDLIIPAQHYTCPEVSALLEALQPEEFKAVVRELGGYDTSDMGKVVGRTGR